MINNSQNKLQKANAIYMAFKPFFSHEQLMQALIHWEENYAKNDTFSIRYYVADITQKFRPGTSEKMLHVSLVSELNRPSLSEEDPIAMLAAYKVLQQQASNPHYSIPEIDAFMALFKKLMAQIPPHTVKSILSYLETQIDMLDIDPHLKTGLCRWLIHANHKITLSSVETQDLREVTTVVYAACCAYLGPTVADEILSSSIKALVNNGGAIYADIFKKLL